jgi:hypothetical protein
MELKMKKLYVKVKIFMLLCMGALFFSCSLEKPNYGILVVSLPESNSSRAIGDPISSDITAALSYQIECSGPGKISREFKPGDKVSIPLGSGVWTVTVKVFNAAGEDITMGNNTASVIIEGGKTSTVSMTISIDTTRLGGGTGGLSGTYKSENSIDGLFTITITFSDSNFSMHYTMYMFDEDILRGGYSVSGNIVTLIPPFWENPDLEYIDNPFYDDLDEEDLTFTIIDENTLRDPSGSYWYKWSDVKGPAIPTAAQFNAFGISGGFTPNVTGTLVAAGVVGESTLTMTWAGSNQVSFSNVVEWLQSNGYYNPDGPYDTTTLIMYSAEKDGVGVSLEAYVMYSKTDIIEFGQTYARAGDLTLTITTDGDDPMPDGSTLTVTGLPASGIMVYVFAGGTVISDYSDVAALIISFNWLATGSADGNGIFILADNTFPPTAWKSTGNFTVLLWNNYTGEGYWGNVNFINGKGTAHFSDFTALVGGGGGSGDDLWNGIPSGSVPLTANQWKDGEITGTASEAWYSFPVTSGTTYYIWWNDSYSGDSTKNLDVMVSAWYDNGIVIFSDEDSGWSSPRNFTSTQTGTVYIKVRPYSSGDTGTFGVAFSTSNSRPDSEHPAKFVGEWGYGGLPMLEFYADGTGIQYGFNPPASITWKFADGTFSFIREGDTFTCTYNESTGVLTYSGTPLTKL